MTEINAWNAKGKYYEVCNCDVICPCRRVDGVAGGKSTTGTCEFAVSWTVDEGQADGVDLAGGKVVIAGYFTDDGPSMTPWTVLLYVDDRCTDEQAKALEKIFLGKAGGDTLNNFAQAFGEIIDVRRVRIELDHTPGGQSMKIGNYVDVQIKENVQNQGAVTCGLPGHDYVGTELLADHMRVNDGKLKYESLGKCGFTSAFSYTS